jgi:carboxylate-amine ligase
VALQKEDFTLGVEEEFQIIKSDSRALRSHAQAILPEAKAAVGDQVTQELYQSMIEIGTPVCQSLTDVRDELRRLRGEVIAAADKDGCQIAAAGTHPFSHWSKQRLTPQERYTDLATDYQQLIREQLIFGCHVHVGIPNRELAIQVMNRVRPWLASLLALASNSPFWLGVDTGYESYRTEIWGRWPMAGNPHVFASRAEYDRLIDELAAIGGISDASNIYWDVRPSMHYETLEFRVTDVCLTIDEAVMVAGLTRGLARTCALEAERYVAIDHVRPEILRAAKWQAARFGLTGELMDLQEKRLVPARVLIEKLLAYIRPALEEYDEWETVAQLVRQVMDQGSGAERQRVVYEQTNSYESVVDFIVAETTKAT